MAQQEAEVARAEESWVRALCVVSELTPVGTKRLLGDANR